MKHILQTDNNNPAIQEVKGAMSATKDARMYQRYQTILLHLKGMTYDQISVIVDRTPTTIGFYVRAYKTSGLVGLELDHSPGRPCRLTEEQEKAVYQMVVEKTPVDVGFPVEMNWTALLFAMSLVSDNVTI
jgi:transposase